MKSTYANRTGPGDDFDLFESLAADVADSCLAWITEAEMEALTGNATAALNEAIRKQVDDA